MHPCTYMHACMSVAIWICVYMHHLYVADCIICYKGMIYTRFYSRYIRQSLQLPITLYRVEMHIYSLNSVKHRMHFARALLHG